MTRSSSLFRTGLAGLVGCLIGTYYERNWSSSNGFRPQSAIHLTESRVQPIPVKIEQVAPASKNRYRPNLEHIQPDHARILSIMQHGFPSIDGLRQFDNFVLSYDRRHRNANWVFEHLTPANLSGEQQPKSQKANRMDFEFFEDLQIHEYFRSSNNDFKRSGYDRGHLGTD